jgi:hypothetical protein
VVVTPCASIADAYIFGTATDADNRFGIQLDGDNTRIRFLNRVGGLNTVDFSQAGFTVTNEPTVVEFYWDGTLCGIRGYSQGDSVPPFTTAAFSTINISTLFEIYSQGVAGFNKQCGNYLSVELSDSKEDFGW